MTKPSSALTVPEVIPFLRDYYALPGNSQGGYVHILTEDDNFEQHFADWCLREAEEHGNKADVRIASLLARLSSTQRRKLSRMSFYPENPDHD